jgi:nitrogen fixation/metabolism regulation signal transduction histidine kinase
LRALLSHAGSRGEGCGLGLAIVKEIVELHNAQIEIDAGAEGMGTRIRIVFQRAAPLAENQPAVYRDPGTASSVKV